MASASHGRTTYTLTNPTLASTPSPRPPKAASKGDERPRMSIAMTQTDAPAYAEHSHSFNALKLTANALSSNASDSAPDAAYPTSAFGRQATQSIAPFLAEHIPEQYAPWGVHPKPSSRSNETNTKFCYRHRPDLKCRRQADEPSMDQLQNVGIIQRQVVTTWLMRVDRNWLPYLNPTSKQSPMSGRSSPPLPLNTAISCCKVSWLNAASRSCPTSPPPCVT